MNFIAKLLFWVRPEDREAKLGYILGAKTVTGFIRALGIKREFIERLIDTIMAEMEVDKEAVLRAIAKMWGVRITIESK